MPSLTTWAAFCPCGQCYPRDQNKHTAAPVKVARQQTTREPSGTFATLPPTGRNLPPILPPEPTPQTLRLRNLPRPSAPTDASIHRNPPKSSEAFRNWPPEPDLHHFTPELSGTFRNLPPEPTPAYAGTLRNLPEPASGTYTSIRRNFPEPVSRTYTSIRRNFQEPSGTRLTAELSGTFRNPPPEPTPAYAGTFRNLPEPPCGTYSSTPQNPLEPSGTFLRNLLLRPAPAHTGAYLGWRPH